MKFDRGMDIADKRLILVLIMMKRNSTLLYTMILVVMFACGCGGCHHSTKSPGADKKYAPCHCSDQF
ncbi:MAG: hypothetical protein HY064_14775 [Bacteroidetes bacterium]|nr:hypothetical protein [Bacteroidota bacterium]